MGIVRACRRWLIGKIKRQPRCSTRKPVSCTTSPVECTDQHATSAIVEKTGALVVGMLTGHATTGGNPENSESSYTSRLESVDGNGTSAVIGVGIVADAKGHTNTGGSSAHEEDSETSRPEVESGDAPQTQRREDPEGEEFTNRVSYPSVTQSRKNSGQFERDQPVGNENPKHPSPAENNEEPTAAAVAPPPVNLPAESNEEISTQLNASTLHVQEPTKCTSQNGCAAAYNGLVKSLPKKASYKCLPQSLTAHKVSMTEKQRWMSIHAAFSLHQQQQSGVLKSMLQSASLSASGFLLEVHLSALLDNGSSGFFPKLVEYLDGAMSPSASLALYQGHVEYAALQIASMDPSLPTRSFVLSQSLRRLDGVASSSAVSQVYELVTQVACMRQFSPTHHLWQHLLRISAISSSAKPSLSVGHDLVAHVALFLPTCSSLLFQLLQHLGGALSLNSCMYTVYKRFELQTHHNATLPNSLLEGATEKSMQCMRCACLLQLAFMSQSLPAQFSLLSQLLVQVVKFLPARSSLIHELATQMVHTRQFSQTHQLLPHLLRISAISLSARPSLCVGHELVVQSLPARSFVLSQSLRQLDGVASSSAVSQVYELVTQVACMRQFSPTHHLWHLLRISAVSLSAKPSLSVGHELVAHVALFLPTCSSLLFQLLQHLGGALSLSSCMYTVYKRFKLQTHHNGMLPNSLLEGATEKSMQCMRYACFLQLAFMSQSLPAQFSLLSQLLAQVVKFLPARSSLIHELVTQMVHTQQFSQTHQLLPHLLRISAISSSARPSLCVGHELVVQSLPTCSFVLSQSLRQLDGVASSSAVSQVYELVTQVACMRQFSPTHHLWHLLRISAVSLSAKPSLSVGHDLVAHVALFLPTCSSLLFQLLQHLGGALSLSSCMYTVYKRFKLQTHHNGMLPNSLLEGATEKSMQRMRYVCLLQLAFMSQSLPAQFSLLSQLLAQVVKFLPARSSLIHELVTQMVHMQQFSQTHQLLPHLLRISAISSSARPSLCVGHELVVQSLPSCSFVLSQSLHQLHGVVSLSAVSLVYELVTQVACMRQFSPIHHLWQHLLRISAISSSAKPSLSVGHDLVAHVALFLPAHSSLLFQLLQHLGGALSLSSCMYTVYKSFELQTHHNAMVPKSHLEGATEKSMQCTRYACLLQLFESRPAQFSLLSPHLVKPFSSSAQGNFALPMASNDPHSPPTKTLEIRIHLKKGEREIRGEKLSRPFSFHPKAQKIPAKSTPHGNGNNTRKNKSQHQQPSTQNPQQATPSGSSNHYVVNGGSRSSGCKKRRVSDSSSSSDEEKRELDEDKSSQSNYSSDSSAVESLSPSLGSEADVSSTYSDRSAAWKRKRIKKPSKGVFHSDPATPPMRSKKSCTGKMWTSEPLSPSSGSEADVSSNYHNRSAAKKRKRIKKSSFHNDPTTPPMHSKKSHAGKRQTFASVGQRSRLTVQPIPVHGHKPKEHEGSESDTSVLQSVVANGFETVPRSKPEVRSHREVKGRFPLAPPKKKKLSKKSTRHTSDTEYGGSSYVSSSSSHKSHPDSDVSTDEPLWTPRYPTQHFFLLLSEDPQAELESISLQPEPAIIRSEEIQQQLQPILRDVYHALLGCRGMPVQIVPSSRQHTGFHLHPYLDLCVAGGEYGCALSVLTALLDCGVLCSQSGVSVAARLIDMTVDVERGRLILGPTCFQSTQTPQAFVQVVLRLAKRLREAVFAYHAGEIATSSVVSCHNAAAAVSVPTTVHQFVAVLSSFIRLVESRLSDEQQVDIEFLKYLVNSQL